MSGNCDDFFKHRDYFARTDGGRNYFCVGGDTSKSELRNRTRGPRLVTGLAELGVRLRMMDVLRPRQRNQEIGVPQVARHASSASSRTCSGVNGGALGGTSKTGNPCREPTFARASNPRRASSEITFPTLLERAAAVFFAALRTSGSMLRVVRIRHFPTWRSHHSFNASAHQRISASAHRRIGASAHRRIIAVNPLCLPIIQRASPSLSGAQPAIDCASGGDFCEKDAYRTIVQELRKNDVKTLGP
jgi:hypothetical protein